MLSGQDGGKGAGQDTAPGPHICACVPAKEDLGQGGPCAGCALEGPGFPCSTLGAPPTSCPTTGPSWKPAPTLTADPARSLGD